MTSGLVLKQRNGECFVIRHGYKLALPASSKFTLTVPTKGLFDFDDGHSYNLKGLQAQVKAYEVIIKENTKCSVAFAGENIELKIMKDGINQEEVAAAIKFLNDLNN